MNTYTLVIEVTVQMILFICHSYTEKLKIIYCITLFNLILKDDKELHLYYLSQDLTLKRRKETNSSLVLFVLI